MNLDDELRRLFADERLDLAVRPDAERTIVAGARRIRRRRFVVGTAAVVAAAMLVGGGIALAGSARPELLPPARTPDPVVTTTTTPVTTTSTPVPSRPTSPVTSEPVPDRTITSATSEVRAPVSATDTITARAYGSLRLRMSGQEASGTGLLGTVLAQDEDCVKYAASYGGDVVVSKQYGVVIIRVTGPVSTAEGVHNGSTVADVKAAYPRTVENRVGLQVDTDAGFMGFAVGGDHMLYEPWPDTGVIRRVLIGSYQNDCALAF